MLGLALGLWLRVAAPAPGEGGGTSPSLNFSDPANSQYLALIRED